MAENQGIISLAKVKSDLRTRMLHTWKIVWRKSDWCTKVKSFFEKFYFVFLITVFCSLIPSAL